MFGTVRAKQPKDTSLAAIIEAVRIGRWREPVEAIRRTYAAALAATGDAKKAKDAIAESKKALPAFCVSGTAKSRTEPVDHSDHLQLDFDGLGDSLPAVREKLKADPHVAFGWVSASGDGLKCGLRIDGSRHGDAFTAAQEYFRQRYGLAIDPAVKDRLRLCFVSYDPEAWTNPEAVPLPLPARPTGAHALPADGNDNASLDVAKLENVQHPDGGSVRAACPACRAAGGDHSGEHLLIDVSGRFGCAKFPGDHLHRKEIWRLAGAGAAWPRAAREAAPDAAGFDKLTAWVRGEILKVLVNKEIAPATKRNTVAGIVVEALRKLGRFYFHVEFRDFDSAMFFDSNRKRLELVRADAFAAWLSEWLTLNRADSLFKFVTAAVETEALSGPGTVGIVPESFWAARPGLIFLSCGDGRAVRIGARAVDLVDNGTDGVLFAAGKTLVPWKLTDPRDPFECCSLFHAARCRDAHGPDLVRVWSYSLPTNPSSKPPMCFTGDVGSGKTRTVKGIAELFGLPFIAHKAEERGENQFWPCMDQGGLFTLDNADTRVRWLPDAVANAATDGCSQQRKLYTNAKTVVLRPRAWLCLTSANPSFANDSGLAARLVVVRMERRGDETGDGILTEEILRHRDAALSHIAQTLQIALADTAPTPLGLNQRHPDFARFAVRIGRALGREAEIVAALRSAEADKSAFCLENDAVAAALLAYLGAAGTFTGTATELVPHLVEADPDLKDKLSPKRCGKRLASLWPHLEKVLPGAAKEKDGRGFTRFRFGVGDAPPPVRKVQADRPSERAEVVQAGPEPEAQPVSVGEGDEEAF